MPGDVSAVVFHYQRCRAGLGVSWRRPGSPDYRGRRPSYTPALRVRTHTGDAGPGSGQYTSDRSAARNENCLYM